MEHGILEWHFAMETKLGLENVMECWSSIGYQTSEELPQNAKMIHGHFTYSRNEIYLSCWNLTRVAWEKIHKR